MTTRPATSWAPYTRFKTWPPRCAARHLKSPAQRSTQQDTPVDQVGDLVTVRGALIVVVVMVCLVVVVVLLLVLLLLLLLLADLQCLRATAAEKTRCTR